MSEIWPLQRLANRIGHRIVVAAMFAAWIVSAAMRQPIWRLGLDPALLPFLALSVVAGFGFTMLGVVLGQVVRAANQRPLKRGGGTSLVLMGLEALGLQLPPAVPLIPLAVGCVISLALTVRARRQGLQSEAFHQRPPRI